MNSLHVCGYNLISKMIANTIHINLHKSAILALCTIESQRVHRSVGPILVLYIHNASQI